MSLEFRDPADLPECSFSRHPVEDIEPESERTISVSDVVGAIKSILIFIVEKSNPRLTAECLCLAFGVQLGNSLDSETALARKHCVSRQAISKRVREVQDFFGGIVGRLNKQAGSRERYRCCNKRQARVGLN